MLQGYRFLTLAILVLYHARFKDGPLRNGLRVFTLDRHRLRQECKKNTENRPASSSDDDRNARPREDMAVDSDSREASKGRAPERLQRQGIGAAPVPRKQQNACQQELVGTPTRIGIYASGGRGRTIELPGAYKGRGRGSAPVCTMAGIVEMPQAFWTSGGSWSESRTTPRCRGWTDETGVSNPRGHLPTKRLRLGVPAWANGDWTLTHRKPHAEREVYGHWPLGMRREKGAGHCPKSTPEL